MNFTTIETTKGPVALCGFDDGYRIATVSDFLDVMMSAGAPTIAIDEKNLPPEFFELKSGIAGEFLQKISNYRKRLVLFGDFQNIESKSLRDFIYESNRTGQVVFAADLEAATALLR